MQMRFLGHLDDLGVDEFHRLAGLMDVLAGDRVAVAPLGVDDDNLLMDADLHRGEADAVRGVHGFEHVIHQRTHLVGDRLHGSGFLLEARIGRDNEGEDGHR